MEFLTSRPSLHVFEVELSHLKIAVTLDRMQDFQEISLTENYLSCRVHQGSNL